MTPYVGIASRLLPLVGTLVGMLANKAKGNPKTGDAALAIGAAATTFGLSPEMRAMAGKALVFIGQALQATVQ